MSNATRCSADRLKHAVDWCKARTLERQEERVGDGLGPVGSKINPTVPHTDPDFGFESVDRLNGHEIYWEGEDALKDGDLPEGLRFGGELKGTWTETDEKDRKFVSSVIKVVTEGLRGRKFGKFDPSYKEPQ